MLNVTAISHASATGELIDVLRRAGVLDITQDAYDLPAPVDTTTEASVRELDELIADAQFTASFLKRFHESDAPFSAFISEKLHLAEDDYYALRADDAFRVLYRECETISDRLATIGRRREHLKARIDALRPWEALTLQISQWRGTEHVVLFTGMVPAPEGPGIRARLREEVAEVSVEELGPVGSRQAWVVMAHRDRVDDVKALLNLTSFTEVSFPELSNYPAEEIGIATDEIAHLDADEERLTERARELEAAHYERAVAIAEWLVAERDAITVRERFGATERAVVVTGWVAAKRRPKLEAAVAPLSALVDLTFTEPGPDDDPPVELDNPRFLHAFETLTQLYGLPKYHELDPTPLLAGFFWLFFGMALGDVGYGIVLAIVAWLIKTRLDVAPGVKRFMDLLIYGGVSAVIFGVLTGSYFAIDVASLPRALQSLIVLDPMKDILLALGISIALGVVHVVFGICLGVGAKVRAGDWDGAVSGDVSTLVLLGALAIVGLGATGVLPGGVVMPALVIGLVLTFVLKGRAYGAPLRAKGAPQWQRWLAWGWLGALLVWTVTSAVGIASAALGFAVLGVGVVGLFAFAAVRSTVLAVLLGVYETYGMTGLLSDFLSYTRLTALGLASVLVGQVMNMLGGMVAPMRLGPLPLGWLFAVVILVVGHGVNIAINLLGAFVHPTRLQFVEFFSKFYEGGGRAYAPFAPATRSVVLHPAPRGQGGGAQSWTK
jgi:V/A-type H+-transporting ATPase subunit I